MRSRSPQERKVRMFALATPVILAIVIAGAAALLGLLTFIGGRASGEHAEIRLRSSCPDAWSERMTQRATDIGIGELEVSVEGDETVLRGILPGLEDDLTTIPALLTRPGELVIAGEGEELAYSVDVEDAWLQMDIMGHPYVILDLQPNAMQRLQGVSTLTFELDREIVAMQRSDDGEIDEVEMQPELQTVEEEVRAATDWKILLQHGPGPCVAESVETKLLQ